MEVSIPCIVNRRIRSTFRISYRYVQYCAGKKCEPLSVYLTRLGVQCAQEIEQELKRLYASTADKQLLKNVLELTPRDDFVLVNDEILSELYRNPKSPYARMKILALLLSVTVCTKKYPEAVDILNKACSTLNLNSTLLQLIHMFYIQQYVKQKGGKNVDLPLLATHVSDRELEEYVTPVLARFIKYVALLLKKHTAYGLIVPGDYYSSIVSIESPNKVYIRLGKNHVIDVEIQDDKVLLVYRDHDPSRVHFVYQNLLRLGGEGEKCEGVAKVLLPLEVFKKYLAYIALVLVLTTSADIMHTTLRGTAEEALKEKYRAVKGEEPSREVLHELEVP